MMMLFRSHKFYLVQDKCKCWFAFFIRGHCMSGFCFVLRTAIIMPRLVQLVTYMVRVFEVILSCKCELFTIFCLLTVYAVKLQM